ncbi:MAG TPA: SOS response-associated peptidase family protein, partial [Saprospiraceae bacterium]|nr:SOS response-associated peptidase family protein [Saprospiraceae bacterium]
MKKAEVFTIAGLYESWRSPDQKVIHSFTLITRDADPVIAQIHDRMPFMLMPDQERLWLDPTVPPKDLLHELKPVPGKELKFYRVSDRVNNVRENDADLIKAI